MVMMSMRDKDAFEMAFLFLYERCDVSKEFRMIFDACVDHVARGTGPVPIAKTLDPHIIPKSGFSPGII